MAERAWDEERLPWLEAVDDEDAPRGLSARKMLAAQLLVVAAVGLVGGTFQWLGRRGAEPANGAPELIRADPHPYKVKPTDPGGLDVAGDSETAFATSAGEDNDARLDTAKGNSDDTALSSAPDGNAVIAAIAKPKTPPKSPPKPAKPQVAAVVPDATAPVPPAARGTLVQLGAYGSTIKADTAWGMLSSRFPEVARLSKSVVTAQVAGKTVVRLRASAASPAEASAACAALRAGGENCLPVN